MCKRPLVVVRHTHVHPDIPLLGRLLHLDFSTLIHPARDEVQLLRRDGEHKRRLGAVGKVWCPVRTSVIRRPVETPNRFEDSAVLGPGNADGTMIQALRRKKKSETLVDATEERAYDTTSRHVDDGACESENGEVYDEGHSKCLAEPPGGGLTILYYSGRRRCGVVAGMFRI